MRSELIAILCIALLFLNNCITQFIPETNENQELLVVEGLLTDRPEVNSVKISKSLPLGKKSKAVPVKGCIVSITDDSGNNYKLREKEPGTYITDTAGFRGIAGRRYTLNIVTTGASTKFHTYKSLPMELKPVPPIDSVYYEKVVIRERDNNGPKMEGCNIFLDSYDRDHQCRYYRWDFTETWEFILPYDVVNKRCWISENSGSILIKNTSILSEDRISKYRINSVSNKTDRLRIKYSILVNQYSLNEEEYTFWEKMSNITENVGSLYDITPSSIPSNIYCVEDQSEKVLGYFSVSAKSSKRIFIKDSFAGLIDLYSGCITDTIYGTRPIPNINVTVWVLIDGINEIPPYRVLTDTKGCADCTVRGTSIKPDFWEEGSK
jgi:hypothetical protein